MSASGRIELTVAINGINNASGAVKSVQGDLKGLAQDTDSAGGSAWNLGELLGEGSKGVSGKAEKGLKGIAKFAGPAQSVLNGLGEQAEGFGKIMEVLPGPVGLATLATVGLGVAAKKAYDYFSQMQAATKLLDTERSASLKESLGLDADAAREVATALEGLRGRALQPTEATLREVANNAKSLGRDPKDAVLKFTEAWAGGADALKKFEAEQGRLSTVHIVSDAEFARVAGLRTELLGLAADEKSEADKNKLRIAEIQQLQAAADAAKADAARQLRTDFARENDNRREQIREIAAIEQQSFQARIAAKTAELRSSEQLARLQAQAKQVEEARGIDDQLRESRIAAAGTKKEAHHLRVQGLLAEQERLNRAMLFLEAARVGVIDEEIDKQLKLLEVAKNQAAAGIRDDRKAGKDEAKQAAEQARARVDAEVAARLRLRQAELDGASEFEATTKRRLELVAMQEAADVRAATTAQTTAKGRLALVSAAHQEAANKRLQIEKEAAKGLADAENEVLDTMRRNAQREADIYDQARTAQQAAAQSHTTTVAMRLRAQGKDLEAAQAEFMQAQADNASALDRIETDRQKRLADTGISAIDVANIEAEAAAKRMQANEELEQSGIQLTDAIERQAQKQREQIAGAANSVSQAAMMAGGAVGRGMSTAANAVAKMAQSWKGLASAAPDMISAAGGVAASFVSGEKTKAGIMAITETAASVAAFADANIAGGVGHATAAALYAGIAGGVIPSASASSGGASGSATAMQSGGTIGNGSSSGNSQPQQLHVHVNGIIVGTPQQMAVELRKVNLTLAGTGFGKAA